MSQPTFPLTAPGASLQEHILGLLDAGGRIARPSASRAGTPQQAQAGIADRLLSRARVKPQGLVGALLRNRARARRANLPRVAVTISVFTPAGRPAVEIRL